MGNTTSADFFAGFVIGALVGAAATLLLAPQSGEQTRSLIREKSVELGQRAETVQSQAKERADQLQGRFKQAVEEGRVAAADKRQELLSQLEAGQSAEEETTA